MVCWDNRPGPELVRDCMHRALLDWLLSKPRKRAQDAFTAGPERRLACHIEDAIRSAQVDAYRSGESAEREHARIERAAKNREETW